jgi:hypothetical protein
VDEAMTVSAPQSVNGVRTLVIPTNAHAMAFGSASQTPVESNGAMPALPALVLSAAVSIKQQVAHSLMQRNPAFFGVGVGQSLDNPKEAALVVYVDRKKVPAQLPQTLNGLRTRYVLMDRLHVTRSYGAPMQSRLHCLPHPSSDRPASFDLLDLTKPRSLNLN